MKNELKQTASSAIAAALSALVLELLKKGVTTTQLQRVRKKAEKLREESGSSSKKDKKKDKKGKKDDNELDMLSLIHI